MDCRIKSGNDEQQKKGGEAPKGASRPLSAPFLPWEEVRKRSQRGPLAFRRSAAALAPASERQDSAQAALHAKHDAKALPPLRIALKRGTSRAGHCAGGDDARPPGSGVTSPARGNRTRSINWLSPVDVPDVSETARLWSSRRQSQRVCICADELGRFGLRVFGKSASGAVDSLARAACSLLILRCAAIGAPRRMLLRDRG